jgi:hypothetical protein
MRELVTALQRLLACPRGTALVGYTSLILLFAVAAITLLGHAGAGSDAMRGGKSISAD